MGHSRGRCLYGNYEFNKNPLAPIGTQLLIHLKADVRASWQNHGEDGWYIGPSMEHYRCVKCYVPTTGRERDADTISFFPKKVKFPKTTTEDYLRQAASDIVFILQNKPSIVPSLDFGDETENALLHISTLLGRAAKPPGAPRVLPTTVPQPTNTSSEDATAHTSFEDATSRKSSEDADSYIFSKSADTYNPSSEGASFTKSS